MGMLKVARPDEVFVNCSEVGKRYIFNNPMGSLICPACGKLHPKENYGFVYSEPKFDMVAASMLAS
jgi:hypothetical protein